jgi:hypothetical protein
MVQEAKLDALGLRPRFDKIVLLGMTSGPAETEPSSVRSLAGGSAIPPDAAVYIGDNPAKDFRRQAGRVAQHPIRRDDGLHRTKNRPGRGFPGSEQVADLRSLPSILESFMRGVAATIRCHLRLTGHAIQAVVEVLRTPRLSMGPYQDSLRSRAVAGRAARATPSPWPLARPVCIWRCERPGYPTAIWPSPRLSPCRISERVAVRTRPADLVDVDPATGNLTRRRPSRPMICSRAAIGRSAANQRRGGGGAESPARWMPSVNRRTTKRYREARRSTTWR